MRDSSVQPYGGWPFPRGGRGFFSPMGYAVQHQQLGSSPGLGGRGTGPPAQADAKFSVQFVAHLSGANPLAMLLVNRADKAYQVTYPMTGGEAHDEVQNAVTGIQRRYAEQAAATATLDQPEGPDDVPSRAQKEHTLPLGGRVAELLGYQEALEIAATLDEAARHDQSQVKKQSELLDKLNTWYSDGLGRIRDEIRNHSGGLDFVRELLRSEKEMLIDLGVRLAREPSIRPALQGDLVRVSLNASLPPQIRQRAFSYLRTEVRQDPTPAP
jgi:hypothetical protein